MKNKLRKMLEKIICLKCYEGSSSASTGGMPTSMITDISGQVSDGMWTAAQLNTDIKMAHREAEARKREFDMTFEENKRQFGLQFALTKWAEENRVTLARAQQLYNQRMGRAELRMAQRGQAMEEKKFRWFEQDREKTKEMQRAYSRGIVGGFFGKNLNTKQNATPTLLGGTANANAI